MAKGFRMIDGKLQEVELEGCANCGNTSGRFRVVGEKKYCVPKCVNGFVGTVDHAKNHFQFGSMNISQDPNQGPVEVQSLSHLRRLEKEHGVISVIGNYDSANFERGDR